MRKLRHNNTHKHNLRNKVRSLTKDTVDYAADSLSNEVNIKEYFLVLWTSNFRYLSKPKSAVRKKMINRL